MEMCLFAAPYNVTTQKICERVIKTVYEWMMMILHFISYCYKYDTCQQLMVAGITALFSLR